MKEKKRFFLLILECRNQNSALKIIANVPECKTSEKVD